MFVVYVYQLFSCYFPCRVKKGRKKISVCCLCLSTIFLLFSLLCFHRFLAVVQVFRSMTKGTFRSHTKDSCDILWASPSVEEVKHTLLAALTSICLSVRLSVCLSVCVCLPICLSVCFSVCVCLSVCLSVRPSVCIPFVKNGNKTFRTKNGKKKKG